MNPETLKQLADAEYANVVVRPTDWKWVNYRLTDLAKCGYGGLDMGYMNNLSSWYETFLYSSTCILYEIRKNMIVKELVNRGFEFEDGCIIWDRTKKICGRY
jgi:hypothetical protein